MPPVYSEAYKNGRLKKVADEAMEMLKDCRICPRQCRVNRLKGERGFCGTGYPPRVYSFMAHHGEEPPISGVNGSGTIFFSGCNMRCRYCQNYEFSQSPEAGTETDGQALAGIMLKLESIGCHNINLVTPTHVMPQILAALSLAVSKGLHIPLVYNTGGYESAEIIRLLEGIIDVYLPDMRYGDADMAAKYSDAPDYPERNQAAVKEMHRQAGVAKMDNRGIIKKGVIIRHLVLPGGISSTDRVMKFIAEELSPDTYISLMSQYSPCHQSGAFPELSRRLTYGEYEDARRIMREYGLGNGWTQDAGGLERFMGTNIKPCL